MTETDDGEEQRLTLEVRDLRWRYPGGRRRRDVPALDGVSFTVARGEAVALLGPNGSGKSTLLRLVCGTLPLRGGVVRLFGRDPTPAARARLGAVFQHTALDPLLTVRENLLLQSRLYGLDRVDATRRIDRRLDEAGLADRGDQPVRRLSGGLARRVDLCRAMLHEPDLLVLDEPTTGLDPAAREAFLDQLAAWRSRSTLTVVMSTHLVDEAERLERVLLLARGRLVADATSAGLRRRLGGHAVTVHDPRWRPHAEHGDRWERIAGGWRTSLTEPSDDAARLAAELADAGVAFSVGPPPLADVFEQLGDAGHPADDRPPATGARR